MTDQPQDRAASGGRSHLGVGSRIKGELEFAGAVELPGHVNGRVTADEIVVEETGDIEGDLHAPAITIKGRFTGQIDGGTVEVHATARLSGDIAYDVLRIDSGAEVEGQCRRRAAGSGPAGGSDAD